eukprot:scaffold557065_cov19-Prasinocladus_malaysianus.AAC.1
MLRCQGMGHIPGTGTGSTSSGCHRLLYCTVLVRCPNERPTIRYDTEWYAIYEICRASVPRVPLTPVRVPVRYLPDDSALAETAAHRRWARSAISTQRSCRSSTRSQCLNFNLL